jgi:group I intron endonuclease
LTTNLINGKKYIGKHSTNNLNDGYVGSGLLLSKAIKKYGKKNFSCEILEYCDNLEDAYIKEEALIKDFNAVNLEEFYNITDGGKGNKGYKPVFTEEWKKRISASLSGKKLTEEHKNNVSKGCKGRKTWNKGKKGVQVNKNKGKKLKGEALEKWLNVCRNRTYDECPHCHRLIDHCVSKRWHFDNCKLSPNFNEEKAAKRKLPKGTGDKVSKAISGLKRSAEQRENIKNSWKNRKEIKCKYCDFKSKSGSVISRFHNENCIHNPNFDENKNKRRRQDILYIKIFIFAYF